MVANSDAEYFQQFFDDDEPPPADPKREHHSFSVWSDLPSISSDISVADMHWNTDVALPSFFDEIRQRWLDYWSANSLQDRVLDDLLSRLNSSISAPSSVPQSDAEIDGVVE